MALTGSLDDNIEIVLSTVLDKAALASASSEVNNKIASLQSQIERYSDRIARFSKQSAESISKLHRNELESKIRLNKESETTIKHLERELHILNQTAGVYKVAGDNIRNNTSLMASLTGNTKQYVDQLNKAAQASARMQNSLGLQGGNGSVVTSGGTVNLGGKKSTQSSLGLQGGAGLVVTAGGTVNFNGVTPTTSSLGLQGGGR